MLSLAGKMVSRSKLLMRVSTVRFFNPKEKVTGYQPYTLKQNQHIGARFMSSWNPEPPEQINASLYNSAPDFDWEGATLDPGPTLSDNGFETSWIETLPTQDAIVAAAPTLQELGLGSYITPVGLLQNALDTLHSAGLPWWGAIAVTTLALRAAVFPLVLNSQRHYGSYLAHMAKAQKFRDLRQKLKTADTIEELTKAIRDYDEYMTSYMIDNPRVMGNVVLPFLVQGSIFLTFFLALKEMAWAPVESLKTGGALWFTDLTVVDPLYLLPVITCATLGAWIQAEAPVRADQTELKNFFPIMSLLLLPFVMHYPAAVLCYWSTTNFFSLVQAYLLKQPDVRKKLNLPPLSAMSHNIEFPELSKLKK